MNWASVFVYLLCISVVVDFCLMLKEFRLLDLLTFVGGIGMIVLIGLHPSAFTIESIKFFTPFVLVSICVDLFYISRGAIK